MHPAINFIGLSWQKYNKEKKKEKDMTYGYLTKANLTLNSILPLVSPIVE